MKKTTKLFLIGLLIFAVYFAWIVPQVIVAIEMTIEANDTYTKNLQSRVSSEEEKVTAEIVREVSDKNSEPALRVFDAIENARISAYTTRPEEGTDCLSASGLNLCAHYPPDFFNGFTIDGCRFGGYGLMACPEKYPFGTEVEIDELGADIDIDGKDYNYICVDLMAESHRDKNHFDIYMGKGEDRVREADQWGVKFLDIKIINYPSIK